MQEAAMGSGVALAEMIEAKNDRLLNLINRLRDLRNRIEL